MLVVSVCIGSACNIGGSYEIIGIFKKCIGKDDLGDKIHSKRPFVQAIVRKRYT